MNPINHGKPWSRVEKARFRLDWINCSMTIEAIADKYGRTEVSVRQKAQDMQLSRGVRVKTAPTHGQGGLPVVVDSEQKREAEQHADKIRAYYATRRQSVNVAVVWVPGSTMHSGCWSARIVDAVKAA